MDKPREIAETRFPDSDIANLPRMFQILDQVVNNAKVVIYIKDLEGRYLFVNKEYERLHHVSIDLIIGETDYEVFPADAAETFRANDLRVLEAGSPVEFEELVPGDEGSHTYISLKFPVRDPQGNVYGVCGISTDITERKRMEVALRESEERYRLLIERSINGNGLIVDGKVVFINRIGVRLLGASKPEDILGKRWLDFILPENQKGVQERMSQVVLGQSSVPLVEQKLLRLDGSLVDVESFLISQTYEGMPAIQFVARDISRRIQTEEALRQSEERFRLMMENASDLIIVITAEGVITYSSPSAERALGYERGELLGRNALEFVHLDDTERTAAAFAECARTPGVSPPIEFRFRCKDSSWLMIEAVGNNCLDQPVIAGIIISARDITERQKTEEWLRLLFQAVDEAPDGLQIVGTDGRIQYSNKGVERLYGFSDEECRGRPVGELNADPDLADGVIIPALLQQGRWDGEIMVKRKDGHTFPIWLSASRVDDSRGKPMAFVGAIRDMTERRRAREAVEAERERLRILIETSPVGVRVEDVKMRRLSLINREAVRILGGSCKEGESFEECLAESERSVVFRRPDGEVCPARDVPWWRVVQLGQKIVAEELRLEFADGRKIPVLISAVPVHSAEGEILEVIAVIQDISRLEEVEKLRGEFLGMVSHELKTPLTAIKGSAAMAMGDARFLNPQAARELFEIINEQSDRLRELVDNLLDMTRIEAGALTVSAEPADLREVLEEARQNFLRGGVVYGEREVQLDLPAELPAIRADARRIAQVMGNLLSNAAKFSPPPEPILVSVERGAQQITVHVTDRGHGIPPEKLTHLFRKFSRLEGDGRGKAKGTGLGLAICKGIVEAHGGRIWAESAGEGEGATFSFTLPLTGPPASEASCS